MAKLDWSYLFDYGSVYRVIGLSSLSSKRRSELRSELYRLLRKNHQGIGGRLLDERTQIFSDIHDTYPDVVFEHPTPGRWIIGDMGVKSTAFRVVKLVLGRFPELTVRQLTRPK